MAHADHWLRFGWQGITLEVPADWDLRSFEGTRQKGYALLADPDMPRLELRWDRARADAPFDQVADRVIRRIARKRKVEVERRTGLVELARKDSETFSCRIAGGPAFHNLFAMCRECGRTVMLRLAVRPGDNVKTTAKRLFRSLQDHSYDGADLWAAYGVEFAAPDWMALDQALLYPGSLDFRFEHRRSEIGVGRVALGSLILKRATLEQWFDSFARKRFKRIRYTARKAEARGHDGLEVLGALRGIRALAPRRLRRRFACRVWYCAPSDRLCYFAVLAPPSTFARLSAYCERVVCHR